MGARLEEHYRMIQDAINLAEKDGFTVEATTCCCGEGLRIRPTNEEYPYPSKRGFDVW
jgi:hypothetical protein